MVNHPGDLNGKLANHVSFIVPLHYSLICQS
jgi:hypothetical protein